MYHHLTVMLLPCRLAACLGSGPAVQGGIVGFAAPGACYAYRPPVLFFLFHFASFFFPFSAVLCFLLVRWQTSLLFSCPRGFRMVSQTRNLPLPPSPAFWITVKRTRRTPSEGLLGIRIHHKTWKRDQCTHTEGKVPYHPLLYSRDFLLSVRE